MQYRDVLGLCDIVRQTSFEIHQYHRSGHLEKIYENALVHRLVKSGLHVERQFGLTVSDSDGFVLGNYITDLYVEQQLIVEIKACRSIAPEHIAQILGYLRGSGVEHGMLINFGSPSLQVRKFILNNL